MGRVGQVVAKRARGFDMKVHYHNRSRLPAGREIGAVYHGTLEELLPTVMMQAKKLEALPLASLVKTKQL